MFQLCRSLSMKTGLAPQYTTALALAANVKVDTSDVVARPHTAHEEGEVQRCRSAR